MSELHTQQKVMAAIMLALRNTCTCESCVMLREVADSLISQLRTPTVGGQVGKTTRGRN